jgi:FtsZ-interacting cell division protein ZipA
MLVGRRGHPVVFYIAIGVVLVALVLIGLWSRSHGSEPASTAPLHEEK